MGVVKRVVAALFPAPNPRAELWAALSESERIEDAGKALDRIDTHVRAYRRLLMCEAGFDPDEFPFDPHGVKPAVHPIDAVYQGACRLVVEPVPVASVAAGSVPVGECVPPSTPPTGHLPDLLDLIDLIEDVLVKRRGMSHRGQAREVAKALESARLTRTAP